MGRGKGRAKGIDVTKHFFQPTGPSDRILVQISPSQTAYVAEEDLSPTQGSEAALALKREGRTEGPMKLCANWRQGACLSHAACSSAHVVAYFNHPATPMVGGHGGATALGSLLQRQHDDGGHSAAQQHNFHAGTAAAESTRAMEHKSPATTTHSTLIPAPRSQQVNRQASSLAATSAPISSPRAGTAWGRNVVVNGNQHGGYQSQQQQQQQHQHPRHHYLQQQQQQQQQQHSAPQGRGSRGTGGYRAQEDINWASPNGALSDILLDAASTKHSGKSEGGHLDPSVMPSISNLNNTPNRADGTNFLPPDNLNGAVGDETWVASMLGQSSVNSAIWYDGFAGLWDIAPSAETTTTARTETTTLAAGEPPLLMTHELNTMATTTTPGELWGSSGGSNVDSTVSANKPVGMSFRSEALKSQLLRELVGAEGDISETTAAETQLRNVTNQNVISPPAPLTEAKNSSGLLNLLGGDGRDAGALGRAGSPGCLASAPGRSPHSIQHLMSLLTTE
ncbi:uncharacterized protein Tco025E_06455 [Trypanosoma conorhini]|uniref:C3H1-type domain-containing protein n=1 Tax=Trypanosoma conorhini TaxID=83891 RepID=A0A3R7P572_9TRYP|nr:uncharacterized protein Tco025E_06455 [Trypanosoma conorhini]RNF12936.1 hypothetical protein Tco025E_06455 [Trypanosoma conorhini]